ncbi:MAG: 4-(cytidine 5'-diphospho)-2-C-methyl-D-erythritol kinase [Bacteroidales bacterium]
MPVGAGLGGGSSDATHTLTGINNLLDNQLSGETLHAMAASLGSDCPFFLHDGAMLAEGRGEILSPVGLALQGTLLVLFHPGVHISTAEAYRGIRPSADRPDLCALLEESVENWKDLVVNDFELSVFRGHPGLRAMKESIYASGALYASLSGSGSAMYGLFRSPPEFPDELAGHLLWMGRL